MSKILPALMVAVGTCCFCCSDFGLYAKVVEGPAADGAQKPGATRIALVDMAAVFTRSTIFNEKREALKRKIKDTEEIAVRMTREVQQLALKLKTLEAGSEDYKSIEIRHNKLLAEFEEFRKIKSAEFLKEESQIYREVYGIVSNVVADYAKEHEIDLVIRENSANVLNEQDPAKLLQAMNKQVIYENNLDITEAIIDIANHP